jgi:hypothetical protein
MYVYFGYVNFYFKIYGEEKMYKIVLLLLILMFSGCDEDKKTDEYPYLCEIIIGYDSLKLNENMYSCTDHDLKYYLIPYEIIIKSGGETFTKTITSNDMGTGFTHDIESIDVFDDLKFNFWGVYSSNGNQSYGYSLNPVLFSKTPEVELEIEINSPLLGSVKLNSKKYIFTKRNWSTSDIECYIHTNLVH